MKKLMMFAVAFAMSIGVAYASNHQANIVVVTHGSDTDAFWGVVRNAVKAAAEDTGADVQYRNPPTGDLNEMASLIEAAIAQNPDGLVVSIPDPDILSAPIRAAVDAGIPVISMNSGSGVSKELGAIMHVGQPEYDAGRGGGERTKGLGGSNGVCFNHEPFNTALLDRCQGFADGLGEELNMVEVSQDFDDIKNTVIAYMTSNPNTGAIMAVGPTGCDPTIAALEEMGRAGDVVFGCFDLGPAIVDGIINGTVQYAIDQQQFLQGYIPVVVLHLNHRNGTLPGNSINSGPGFVTKANIEQVKKLAGVER
ncbi:MAG: sugar ABC transporter substrate-binding protein [Hyphomicrobiales bacterium]|nr:sugar ABC transporter substrate-binding protein [Hyphomicrobiales bacterium]MCY4048406.1 sugar ABC transporter substrate-binding protein [Hyphomicrobiales bacterium]MCY4053622.1 sugar ABC transporter substrate-binding protein [Hyphomicrobiales bacterium]